MAIERYNPDKTDTVAFSFLTPEEGRQALKMAIDLVVEKCGEFQFVPAEGGHVMPTRGYIIFKLRGRKNAVLSLTEEAAKKKLKDGLQLSDEDFRAMLLPHGIYLWNRGDEAPDDIKGEHNPDVAARHRQARVIGHIEVPCCSCSWVGGCLVAGRECKLLYPDVPPSPLKARALTNAELAAAIDYAYNKTGTSDLGVLMRKHLEVLLEIQRARAAAIKEVSGKPL